MSTKAATTAITKWESRLGGLATEAMATTGKDANAISIRGGVMKYRGQKIKDGELKVVIIDHVFANSYYLKPYDQENPEAPDCFATGRVEADMVPHPNSFAKQAETCADCPMNQYESDPKGGKGKACKNTRKLDLITEDSLVQITKADTATLTVPPTSTKAYDKFVKVVGGELKRPPLGVVTLIKVEPHETKQIEVSFELEGKVEDSKFFPKDTDAGFELLLAKKDEVAVEIEKPYDKKITSAGGSKGAGKDRKFSKPAVAAKKSAAPKKMARR
jgi:hypothetical protein